MKVREKISALGLNCNLPRNERTNNNVVAIIIAKPDTATMKAATAFYVSFNLLFRRLLAWLVLATLGPSWEPDATGFIGKEAL